MPNARCFVLENNWRSHPDIVELANRLLTGMSRRRIRKEMVPGWEMSGDRAVVGPQLAETEAAEAEWVAAEIESLLAAGRNPQDIAILYRYNRYASLVEEALFRRGIKCLTTNPDSTMVPDEVADIMAFLRLVMDPDGPKARESFERVCQLRTKEVDPRLFNTIASFAEANNLSFLKAVEIYSEAVADQSCQDLEQLVRIIRTMNHENLPPAETIALLKRTQRLSEYYKAVKVPPGVNYEPMRKLTQLEEEARKFKTVGDFVRSQTSPKVAEGQAEPLVFILSLHESKGKEFPVVFLTGMAEGLFPSETASDPEEERRLCYLGMTRAKDMLYVSYPGKFNDVVLAPSRFLLETMQDATPRPVSVNAPTQMPTPTPSPTSTSTNLSKPAVSETQTAAHSAQQEAALRAQQEAALRAQQEAALRAQQEAALRAQQEAALRAQQEAALKAQQEAALRAQQEAALRAQQEAALKAQQEAALKAQQEAALRAQQEAALRAQQEAALKAQQEAALKAQQEAALRAQQEAALRAQQEAALRVQQEAAQREAALRAQQEAELRAQQEAALRAQQEAALRAQQEAALRAQQEAALRAQQEAELRAQQEALKMQEASVRAQQEAALRAQQEAALRAQQEAALRAQQEAALRAQQEAALRAQQEAALRAQQEAALKAQQEAALNEEAAKEEAARKAKMEELQRAQQEEEQRLREQSESGKKGKKGKKAQAREEEKVNASDVRDVAIGLPPQSTPQAESAFSMPPAAQADASEDAFWQSVNSFSGGEIKPGGKAGVPPGVTAPIPQPDIPVYSPVSEPQVAQTRPAQELCPGCSEPLDPGSRFCGECGFRLETKIISCHLCGAPQEGDAKFCGECGSKLHDNKAAPAAPDAGSPLSTYEGYLSGQKPSQAGWVTRLKKIVE
ncbi:MAG: ATP-dependent DNA helicase PcrA [bacterium ADurb.Bin425]|nr:MAG: ATP-dependent DNA helicase PcrA [bacterium ADurb.Bin425]